MSGGGIERLKERLHMLPAVKQGRVCVVTERLYRLSPRAVAGIEEMARCAAGILMLFLLPNPFHFAALPNFLSSSTSVLF